VGRRLVLGLPNTSAQTSSVSVVQLTELYGMVIRIKKSREVLRCLIPRKKSAVISYENQASVYVVSCLVQ
jgi:hypothetical protein